MAEKIPFRMNYQNSKGWYKPTVNTEPSMVQPEHADELEINNVMARYMKTGFLPVRESAAQWLDLTTGVTSFEDAQDKLLAANRLWLELPFDVRDEFRTPQGLINAFSDQKKRARLEEYGFLEAPVKKEPGAKAAGAGSGVQPQDKSPEGTPAS